MPTKYCMTQIVDRYLIIVINIIILCCSHLALLNNMVINNYDLNNFNYNFSDGKYHLDFKNKSDSKGESQNISAKTFT